MEFQDKHSCAFEEYKLPVETIDPEEEEAIETNQTRDHSKNLFWGRTKS